MDQYPVIIYMKAPMRMNCPEMILMMNCFNLHQS